MTHIPGQPDPGLNHPTLDHSARPRLDPGVLAKADALMAVLAKGKALDILAFDISRHSSFADALFIATATSSRHAQALADQVLAAAPAEKLGYLRMEGHNAGQWILLDCGDVIVNILLPAVRELYRLEGLWSGCPIFFGTPETATQAAHSANAST